MKRCANATGAGMTALRFLMKLPANPRRHQVGKWLATPQSAGFNVNVLEVQ